MSSSGEVLQVPALGRPFGLGMLYDCRSDQLIPGITLWDQENIEKDLVRKQQPTSDFSVEANDNIASKSNALDIEAGIKLSFLGGLISVSGSAKYLDDRTTSNHQSRVVAKYKCTTVFKSLSMNHLGRGNVKYPYVFDQGTATHVVTAIMYGAHAFFVFDNRYSEEEIKKDVKGELKVIVKSLPCVEIEGHGSVKMSSAEKETTDGCQVTFYGDFQPSTNPTKFEEAVRLYKELPQQLGPNKEKAVPVTVWLYPLYLLDSKAAQLVRQISANLVSQTEECIEQFHELTIRCNDLDDSVTCRNFPGIRKKIKKFRGMVTTYEAVFTKQLMPILPKIRGGGAEESELLQVIINKEESPFGYRHLTQWLDNCEEQIRVMGTYIRSMSSVKFAANPGDVSAQVMDPKYKFCLCFNIQLTTEDQLVTAMEDYLKQCNSGSHKPTSTSVSDVSLFDRVKDDMASNARNFIDFHDANSSSKTTCFIVAEDKAPTSQIGSFIYLYKDGKIIDRDFKPPSRPGKPEAVEIAHDKLELNWKPTMTGVENLKNYKVLYKKVGTDSLNSHQTTSNSPALSLQDLTPLSLYEVKITAMCEAGTSQDSESTFFTTRPTNPPDELKVWQSSALAIGIQWQKPTVIADEVVIKSYDIERALVADHLEWETCGSTEKDTLSQEISQDRGIPYKYRVIANCGEHSSLPRESDNITVTASKKDIIKRRIVDVSRKLVNEGASELPMFQIPLEKVSTNEDCMVRKKTFGKPAFGVEEKVILVVGATGAGKTTFINGIFNYIVGVEWKDDFRFRLVEEDIHVDQAESVTQWITAYTIYHQKDFEIPFTLTIVDTPGFGDTSGIERDKRIAGQVKDFFKTPAGKGGIDHIDAVGFVIQASAARLTPTQRFIFDSILSLFGKDIKDNIFLLITFADDSKPPVLDAVESAKLPYKKYFKFNNSALFASTTAAQSSSDEDEDEGTISRPSSSWTMGIKSYNKFFLQLKKSKSKSLTLTKDVLEERKIIETKIEDIQRQIPKRVETLERIAAEKNALKDHEAEIERTKHFTYPVMKERIIELPLNPNRYATSCTKCTRTCDEYCTVKENSKKWDCWPMLKEKIGWCYVCDYKCHWTEHYNSPCIYERQTYVEYETSYALKSRYEKARGDKLTAEGLVKAVEEEFETVQNELLSMTEEIRKLINNLEKIALKPNPLSPVDYIDILIENEKREGKQGWKQRMENLQEIRQKAETKAKLQAKVADESFNLLLS